MKLTLYRGHYYKHAEWKRHPFVLIPGYLLTKNFQILIIFIEVNVNVCLLCAHHLMTSIILHTRRPICNKKAVTHLVFAFLGSENHVFHIVPFRPTWYVLKSFRCLEVSNRIRNWNKVKNNIYVRAKFKYANSKYQYS
jgi:hypothetical protein